MGVAKDGTTRTASPAAWSCWQIHSVRRGGARQPHQTADRAPRPRDSRQPQKFGIGLKELWQVAPEKFRKRPGPAHHGLAARQRDRRRLVSLSFRRQSGRGRLCRAPQLRQSVFVAVRGVPALQDAPAGARHLRRRPAYLLRRARHHRGRLAVGAEARFPRRRADRLRGRVHERAADQGQPQRDALRHDGGGACRGGAGAGRAA